MDGDNPKKIKSFTDLHVWKEGHLLVLDIYRLTKKFPKEEQFSLTNQLQRAAISFTSNIAEGFNRSSWKEKSQFYSISFGSLSEIQNQLLIAKDLGYIPNSTFQSIAKRTVDISKMTNALIQKTKAYAIHKKPNV